jgi:arylsulfatase A-like enzyme
LQYIDILTIQIRHTTNEGRKPIPNISALIARITASTLHILFVILNALNAHFPTIIFSASSQVSNALVSQIDWFASLASLVGAGLPKGAAPDSFNYLDTWLGKNQSDRSWVIEQASNHTLSVRTKDWKYIEPNDGPAMITWGPKIETGNLSTPQLYHVVDDVAEQKNVASLHPDLVFELQNILRHVRMKNLKP